VKIYVGRPSKYNTEFRSDAVALWRASAGRRTFKDVAADLNVNPETLRTWVRDAENGGPQTGARPGAESVQAELARLRAENARLVRAEKEWQLEREILRRAAQYFAREMK
jgi:transposase